MQFGATFRAIHQVRRWAVVALVIVVFAMLGDLSYFNTGVAPQLGMDARWRDGGLVVVNVQPAGLAWMDGVHSGDTVLEIDGVPINDTLDPATVASATSVSVADTARGVVTTAIPAPGSALVLSFLTAATLFLIVGSAVFVLASDGVLASIVLAWTMLAAMLLVSSVGSVSGAAWESVLTLLSVIGFAATTLLLTLAFPIDRLRTRYGRVGALSAGVAVALLVAWYALAIVTVADYASFRRVALAFVVLMLLFAAALLGLSVLQTSPQRRAARRGAGQLALGAIAGLTPFAAFSLAPFVLGFGYILPPEISVLAIVLFPAALGAAILSRQFLPIDRLFNRSFVALIVWLILLAAYVSGATAISGALGWSTGENQRQSLVLMLVFTVTTFPLMQHWLRRRLETALFNDLYDPAVLVREIGDQLMHLQGVPAIAEYVLESIGKALDVTGASLRVDADVQPNRHYTWGDPHASGMVIQLAADKEPIGTLVVGLKRSDVQLSSSDHIVLEMIRPLVSTALQNALLVRRLEAQVVILAERERALAALNSKLISVGEEERRALALDLHDDALQQVVLLAREMSTAVQAASGPAVEGHVERWRESAHDIAIALRAVCRDLRPPVIDDLGLGAALEWLATDVRTKSELEIETDIDQVGRLDPGLEMALYRVAQEGLNNVRKHAEATSVRVRLERSAEWLRLEIADDGKGVDPAINGTAPGGLPSLGLLGMRERVAPWGGRVRLAQRPDGGTSVSAEVPLVAAALAA